VLHGVGWLIGWLVTATYPSLFSKIQNTIPSRIQSGLWFYKYLKIASSVCGNIVVENK
jgi:hypothetical protein